MRKSSLSRRTALKSSGRPKRKRSKYAYEGDLRVRRKKRKPSETLRIYGPKGYVEWIHQQPCACCGIIGYSVVAHIGNGGIGRKSDWTQTIPLCGPRLAFQLVPDCHFLYDEKPWLLKEVYPRFHVFTAMAETQSRWQQRGNREEESK